MIEMKLTFGADTADGIEEGRAVVAAMVGYFGHTVLDFTGPSALPVGAAASSPNTEVLAESRFVTAMKNPPPDGYPVVSPAPEPTAAEAFAPATNTLPPNAIVSPGPSVDQINAASATFVERDADGLPWDDRIHSSSKKKTDKGLWVRRRNIQDVVFDRVTAELKAANTARTVEALANIPALPKPPAPEPSAAEAFGVAPTPPAPTSTPGAPAGAQQFLETMKLVTPAQASGKLTPEKLQETLAAVGVEKLSSLAAASIETHEMMRALVSAL